MITDTTSITGTSDYNGSSIRFEYYTKDRRYLLNVATEDKRAVLSEDGNGTKVFSCPTMAIAESIKLYQLLCEALEAEVKPYVEGKL